MNKPVKNVNARLILLIAAALTTALATASGADAKAIWQKDCTKCHGADGSGHTVIGKKLDIKDFTDAAYQAKLKDEEMFKAIKEGIRKDGSLKMKPVEGLDDAQIKALVAYVRSLKK